MGYEVTRERGRDDVIREEAVNLTTTYLLLAREVARHDMEHACAITGLPRSFLETLAQTTVGAVRQHLAAVQTSIVFVPRLPLTYWNQLSAALRNQSVSNDMLACYAAALSLRLDDHHGGESDGEEE
jgi:hypothetical protein